MINGNFHCVIRPKKFKKLFFDNFTLIVDF